MKTSSVTKRIDSSLSVSPLYIIQINIKVIFLDEYTFLKTEEEFLESIEAKKFTCISYADNLVKNQS